MNKKILLVSFLSVVILSGCGKDSTASEPLPATESVETSVVEVPFDITSYKETASAFNSTVTENMVVLYNMGKHEYNLWDSYESLGSSPDFSSLPARAYEWLMENSEHSQETVVVAFDDISSQYTNIITISTEGAVAEEIEVLIKDIYSSYASFYNLVTAPSGSLDEFATLFNKCVQELNQNTETLSILLSNE